MQKLISPALALGILLIVASPVLAQGAESAASQYDPGTFSEGEVIRTQITETGDWYIRVQHPEDTGNTAKIHVSEGTEILRQDGTPATFGNLRVGQYIELTFTGPLDECPPDKICTAQIAAAHRIVILEDTAKEDPEDDTDQGTKVLPDTGGAVIPLLGVGALLIACGLITRRIAG